MKTEAEKYVWAAKEAFEQDLDNLCSVGAQLEAIGESLEMSLASYEYPADAVTGMPEEIASIVAQVTNLIESRRPKLASFQEQLMKQENL